LFSSNGQMKFTYYARESSPLSVFVVVPQHSLSLSVGGVAAGGPRRAGGRARRPSEAGERHYRRRVQWLAAVVVLCGCVLLGNVMWCGSFIAPIFVEIFWSSHRIAWHASAVVQSSDWSASAAVQINECSCPCMACERNSADQ